MPQVLDRQAVQDWLRGQRVAAARLEAERASLLLSLTSRRALEAYLELCRLGLGATSKAPSLVLLAMRRALRRLEEGKKG